MIKNVVVLSAYQLKTRVKAEHIKVTYDSDGNLIAISWLFGTEDVSLYQKAKARKGVWDYAIKGWKFPKTSVAQSFLEEIVHNHPDWPITGSPDAPYMPLTGAKFSRFKLTDDFEACLIPLPLPYFAIVDGMPSFFQISASEKRKTGVFIGKNSAVNAITDSMIAQGAICNDTLLKKWPFIIGTSNISVKVNGWAIEILCNLNNPLHYLLAPEQKFKWEGEYPDATKVAIPWSGKINTTRKSWSTIKIKFNLSGLNSRAMTPKMH